MFERDERAPARGAGAPQDAAASGIVTVAEITRRIRECLSTLGRVAVQGEVASLRRASSGHLYFNLKDRLSGVESVLACTLWRSRAREAERVKLVEGARVIAHGRIDVYAPRGSYSLDVERLEPLGLGALLLELEALKRELAELGWFERRRPIPRLPRVVGVVTSRDGAAFQDFLKTRSQRWPLFPVRLVHTPVQGQGAARSIADAIARLDASGVDVIVVCRGGGSLEDLWCFNERAVAEAIHASRAPVVTGVGHETDTTLADLVADLRAHTPTDAAQQVIPDRAALDERLARAFDRMLDVLDRELEKREERVERAVRSRALRGAAWILEERRAALERLGRRLVLASAARAERIESRAAALEARLKMQSPRARLERAAERIEEARRRLCAPLPALLQRGEGRVELLARALEATSPFAVLKRGYSITRRAGGGAPIARAGEVAPGERIESLLADGSLVSVVEASRPAEGP